MNNPAETEVTVKCSYCGQLNPQNSLFCRECGTPFAPKSEPEQKPAKVKSKTTAVLLAIVLGPLGLCYTNLSAGLVMFAVFLVIRFSVGGGIVLLLVSRAVCAGWAMIAFTNEGRPESTDTDATSLLNEAASLESVDRTRAIIAYQRVMVTYPGTSAAEEARRNIETLNTHARDVTEKAP
jgi:hypothetical protein